MVKKSMTKKCLDSEKVVLKNTNNSMMYKIFGTVFVIAAMYFIYDRVVTNNIHTVPEFFGGGLAGVTIVDESDPVQFGYSVGHMFGQQVKQGMDGIPDDVVIDREALIRGIADVVSDKKSSLSEDKIQELLKKRAEMEQKKFEEKSTLNLEVGNAFIEEYKTKELVQELGKSVLYTTLTKGDGIVLGDQNVGLVHYRGILVDGTEFDSSYKNGDVPVAFSSASVIPGFGAALSKMRVGDKWEIVIPADQAYGAYGSPGTIGPNETLIFTVELVGIQDIK